MPHIFCFICGAPVSRQYHAGFDIVDVADLPGVGHGATQWVSTGVVVYADCMTMFSIPNQKILSMFMIGHQKTSQVMPAAEWSYIWYPSRFDKFGVKSTNGRPDASKFLWAWEVPFPHSFAM
ncbi:hypothetical protein C8J56DRAFT_1050551 [Mycena floridula]|nr:hypothetical protein C8J56DRAFT_1050551 [Mycena floridula]